MKDELVHDFLAKIPSTGTRLAFEFIVKGNGVETITLRKHCRGQSESVSYTLEEFVVMFTELATMMRSDEFLKTLYEERYIVAATEIQEGMVIEATYLPVTTF
jgi:hypothetical protein